MKQPEIKSCRRESFLRKTRGALSLRDRSLHLQRQHQNRLHNPRPNPKRPPLKPPHLLRSSPIRRRTPRNLQVQYLAQADRFLHLPVRHDHSLANRFRHPQVGLAGLARPQQEAPAAHEAADMAAVLHAVEPRPAPVPEDRVRFLAQALPPLVVVVDVQVVAVQVAPLAADLRNERVVVVAIAKNCSR